ncbi:DUF5063 domain-containing protein [Nostoc sp. PCC 7107]|uniref:DUF5063 domain-containing protein n=1 Tax=Nostoc sp. PCC 7107 TaxID=317936 RepID=UPI00029F2157|nr:DUF5063 domain-containing protein [Nostoc sp. PCC 7107]AFY44530.1 hypothetical protein Nos7107_3976 [Nostoc sp. PCC 7107]
MLLLSIFTICRILFSNWYKYCDWAEGYSDNPEQDIITARKLLAELHLGIIDLLEIDLPDMNCEEEVETVRSSYELSSIYQRLKILPIDNYWDVFEPLNLEDNQPVLNSIIDDLNDIYQDLKRGLIIYNQAYFMEALWEWCFHFEIHWGAHLVGAQRAIHNYFS